MPAILTCQLTIRALCILKSEKDDDGSKYVNQMQALRPGFPRNDEI